MTEENKIENQEEIQEIGIEELQQLIGGSESDKLPPIEISLNESDEAEFKRGISETSYISGVIVALLNTGVSEQFVSDLILNRETIEHNLKTAQINKDMNIEMSKNQRVAAEKQEL